MSDDPALGEGGPPAGHRARVIGLSALALVLLVVGLAISVQRSSARDEVRAGAAPGASGSGSMPPSTTSSAGTDATSSSTAASDPPASTASTASTATAPASAPPPPAAPKGPAHLSLLFAGDLLPHGPLDDQAARYGAAHGARYDFGPMLAPMAKVIGGADLAICHMETPVAPDQDHITGYPAFGAPAELVDAIAGVGYDGCSTASNHSLDQGRAGIAATLDRFDHDHLQHAGTARTAEEGAAITTYVVHGARVAHLSYAYDFNGYKIPGDAPFAVNQINAERIKADAHRARQAGAQLVVVSLHWGTEYQHEPSKYQRDVVSLLLPSDDIDLIIGHHAHVVQPIEQVDGTDVVWGLGNQLANQPQIGRSDGLTVKVDVRRRPDGRYEVAGIEAIPTYVEAGGTYRVWPIAQALASGAAPPGLRATLRESYARTMAVVRQGGAPGVRAPDLPT